MTVNGSPSQPAEVDGTTVYTTSTGDGVVLVNASSDKSVEDKPPPKPAPPEETVNPLSVRAVIS